MMFHDQARAPLGRQKGPYPLHEDTGADTGGTEIHEMDRGPDEPDDEPAHPHTRAVQDGESLPDHRHVPLVEIAEGTRGGFAGDPAANRVAGNGEIRLHLDPPRAIRLYRQPLPCWRWRHTGGPDHGLARDPFTRDDDAVLINVLNGVSQLQ